MRTKAYRGYDFWRPGRRHHAPPTCALGVRRDGRLIASLRRALAPRPAADDAPRGDDPGHVWPVRAAAPLASRATAVGHRVRDSDRTAAPGGGDRHLHRPR